MAFRFPVSGGLARLYRLPNMEEVRWRFELGRRRPVRMIGFASDDDVILALGERDDDAFELIALDLVAGLAYTVDSNVANAAVGPTGTAYVSRPSGVLGEVEHRAVDIWPDTLTGNVTEIRGAARGRLLAVIEGEESRELVLLARGQTQVRQSLPSGTMAVERWGRLVAVLVDSGLTTFDPTDSSATDFIPVTPRPRLVTFSTSGHQIYVVAGDQDLAIVDRFQGSVGRSMRLPGRVAALRVGPLGRKLLAYSEEESAVWVIDLMRLAVDATLPGSWEDDLPSVAGDGTVLLRHGGSLVAYSGETLEQAGAGPVGADDLWLVAQWDPRRPALELARDSTRASVGTGRSIFVQISSSRNAAWAQALADELSGAGMPATVLPADSTDDLYRVVMGPYRTREEAEASARRLGRPFFIREIDTSRP